MEHGLLNEQYKGIACRNQTVDRLQANYYKFTAIMQVREIISAIEADGWFLVATRGSHRQYKHPSKKGRVTLSDDVAAGTMNSILKQAGLKEEPS